LLAATEAQFARIAAEVRRRTKKPLSKAEIALKVGRVLDKHKVGKHFALSIEDGVLVWQRKQADIDAEAALDGIYVIRGSEPATELSADDAVRNYKQLADVEQVFRTLKGMELLVRPIHHRADGRVRAHLFVCLLACYVRWHLKRAWAPLLFADEHLAEHRRQRDAVAPAEPAEEVRRKKRQRRSAEGLPLHSFRTLLADLATQCRQTCQFGEGESIIEIRKLTDPTPLQTESFRLLRTACSQ
jgi:transposase